MKKFNKPVFSSYGYTYTDVNTVIKVELPTNISAEVFPLYRDGFLSDKDLSDPERIASRANIKATVPQKRRNDRTETVENETSMGNAFAKAKAE